MRSSNISRCSALKPFLTHSRIETRFANKAAGDSWAVSCFGNQNCVPMSHQPVTPTHSTPTQLSDSSNRFRSSLLEAAWIKKFPKVRLQHRKHGKSMEILQTVPALLVNVHLWNSGMIYCDIPCASTPFPVGGKSPGST